MNALVTLVNSGGIQHAQRRFVCQEGQRKQASTLCIPGAAQFNGEPRDRTPFSYARLCTASGQTHISLSVPFLAVRMR